MRVRGEGGGEERDGGSGKYVVEVECVWVFTSVCVCIICRRTTLLDRKQTVVVVL